MKTRTVRPTLLALEDRCLPSAMPIIPNLPTNPTQVTSTVPANGDVNPYGVAFVPNGFAPGGMLHAGDVLVSNFNNGDNLQGTGTTIVDITPSGRQKLFFQGSGLGLTTALGVLRQGFVIVGNLPTTDGTSATAQPGSLLILNRFGKVVLDLSNSTMLDGPWDLAVVDHGTTAQVFVANVLSGTVTRLDLVVTPHMVHVVSMTQIGSGYAHHSDPAALEVGPTGLAYDPRTDTLYVAATADNAIFAIHHAAVRHTDAGMGTLVYRDDAHLHGPLGLALAPNGDLITTNGDAVNPPSDPSQENEMVEFTPQGQFVGQRPVDTSADGAAFGLAVETTRNHTTLAAVDDATNTLEECTIPGH